MSMKSFQTYLQEALLDVDVKDIDKIYAPMKKAMKELSNVWKEDGERFLAAGTDTQEAIANTMMNKFREIIKKNQPIHGPLKTFDSSQLKSENAQKAHAVNPIKINVWLVGPRVGANSITNAYVPSRSEIHICLDSKVAEAMMHRLQTVPHYMLAMLRNEVSDLKHKSTIRHELTHWIDDSLHNFHIRTGLGTVQASAKTGNETQTRQIFKKVMAHGEEDIYLSPVEITPMVNQIDDFRKRIGQKKYDKLTWKELCIALPSIGTLNQRYGAYFRKKMFPRLVRENLFGKNFRAKLS